MKNCVINDAASRKLTLCNNHLWHILWFLFLQFLVGEIFLNITKLLAKIGREQIPLWPPKALAWCINAPPKLSSGAPIFSNFWCWVDSNQIFYSSATKGMQQYNAGK